MITLRESRLAPPSQASTRDQCLHGFWFLPFATFAPGYLGFRFSPPVSLFLLLCPSTAFTAKHTILPRPRRRRSRGDEGAGVPEGGGHRSHRRHRLSRRVELRRRKAVSAVKSRLLINNSSLTHPDPTLGVGRGSLLAAACVTQTATLPTLQQAETYGPTTAAQPPKERRVSTAVLPPSQFFP